MNEQDGIRPPGRGAGVSWDDLCEQLREAFRPGGDAAAKLAGAELWAGQFAILVKTLDVHRERMGPGREGARGFVGLVTCLRPWRFPGGDWLVLPDALRGRLAAHRHRPASERVPGEPASAIDDLAALHRLQFRPFAAAFADPARLARWEALDDAGFRRRVRGAAAELPDPREVGDLRFAFLHELAGVRAEPGKGVSRCVTPPETIGGPEPEPVTETRLSQINRLIDLLLVRGPVRRDELAKLLYPDDEQADQNLRRLLTRLRKELPKMRPDAELVETAGNRRSGPGTVGLRAKGDGLCDK